MTSKAFKSIVWCVFLVGLAGAGVGIGQLHTELAVFWLIVASVSGLFLLKLRDAPVREIPRPSTEFHSQAA